MNPLIAAVLFTAGIVGLFWLDRDREVRTSKALWLPVVWFMIGASRNVSEWLSGGPPVNRDELYLEGSPIDRNLLGVMLLIGLIVLFARRERSTPLLRSNLPILAYISYCLFSLLWSDYPFVGLKRWFRLVGDLTMVLVVLTDVDWVAAIERVLKRVAFVLIPLSVLFIRYYPALGRSYGNDGTASWTGVATGKNGLGAVCLIFGFGSLWRCVTAYRDRTTPHRGRRLIAHGAILAFTAWLFTYADSMTSLSCFLLAAGVLIVITKRGRDRRGSVAKTGTRVARSPAAVHLVVGGLVSLAMYALFFGGGSGILSIMGRNSTLTGRRDIWNVVLSFADNPLLGAGFETFWLGKRIEDIQRFYVGLSQAHNGYIETYLELGWIGIAFLVVVIAAGYIHVMGALRRDPAIGSLQLGYLVIAVIYNCTEGAFKFMFPVWIGFVLATMALPHDLVRVDEPSTSRKFRSTTNSYFGAKALAVRTVTASPRARAWQARS